MADVDSKICFIVTFVFFVIWIGLFTGLNLPQMKRMNIYFKTDCLVNDSMIVRRYCPTKSCGDNCNSFSGSSCGDITSQMESVNPDTCNTTCPTNSLCDNGHYCCETTCSSWFDSNHNRHTTCSCSQSTNHHECTIIPQLCYTLRLFLQYNTTNGEIVWTDYDFDMGDNQQKAIEYQTEKYQTQHIYGCFYDSQNLANVKWTIGYTVGFWVASGLFAFFTFIGCITTVSLCIEDSSDGGNMDCWHMTNCWFWIGIVLGLCLFLPLGLDAHIPEPSRTHLLRLAIVWTTMWTGFYLIYLGHVFDCWIGLRQCYSVYFRQFQSSFWMNWNAFHTWSKRNIDEGLCIQCNAFFCGCCNWCADTVKYVCKDRKTQTISETPPPPEYVQEDALSDMERRSAETETKLDMRPPSYRTAIKAESTTNQPSPLSIREKCRRLFWNDRSTANS